MICDPVQEIMERDFGRNQPSKNNETRNESTGRLPFWQVLGRSTIQATDQGSVQFCPEPLMHLVMLKTGILNIILAPTEIPGALLKREQGMNWLSDGATPAHTVMVIVFKRSLWRGRWPSSSRRKVACRLPIQNQAPPMKLPLLSAEFEFTFHYFTIQPISSEEQVLE